MIVEARELILFVFAVLGMLSGLLLFWPAKNDR